MPDPAHCPPCCNGTVVCCICSKLTKTQFQLTIPLGKSGLTFCYTGTFLVDLVAGFTGCLYRYFFSSADYPTCNYFEVLFTSSSGDPRGNCEIDVILHGTGGLTAQWNWFGSVPFDCDTVVSIPLNINQSHSDNIPDQIYLSAGP